MFYGLHHTHADVHPHLECISPGKGEALCARWTPVSRASDSRDGELETCAARVGMAWEVGGDEGMRDGGGCVRVRLGGVVGACGQGGCANAMLGVVLWTGQK